MKTLAVASLLALVVAHSSLACRNSEADASRSRENVSETKAGVASNEQRIFGVTRESQGRVTIELTPEKHEKGQLVVAIRVTTHTVDDLEKYDLKQLTTLESDGESTRPDGAPQLKGHHVSGELTFPLASMPEAFSIEIRDLDKPELRVFSWP